MFKTASKPLQTAIKAPNRLNTAKRPVSFLPVPVAISAKVQRAFNSQPITHRSNEFRRLMDETKSLLLNLTGAANVEIFIGSGTLANDVVAAQLKLLDGEGLVLANGLFGERLIDHATRHGLRFKPFTVPWGEAFNYSALNEMISGGTFSWIWATHCETFLGILNNLEKLEEICREHDVKLCMDCISSVGTVAMQLNSVYLATTVSGKGLASYPGIAIVLYNHEAAPDNRLPIYLDLGYYRSKNGVPFTHSHNLVAALREALLIITAKPKFEFIRRESIWFQKELEQFGIRLVSRSADVSPAVLTLAVPPSVSSESLGDALEERGFLVSYRGDYLVNNNLLRVCLMGATTHGQHRQMLDSLISLYSRLAGTERIKTLNPTLI